MRETGEMPSALNWESRTCRPASAQATSACDFREAVAPATSREAKRTTATPMMAMTRTTRTDMTSALPRWLRAGMACS